MSVRLVSSVVYLLGAALLSCIAGIVLLAVLDKTAPDILSQVVIGSLTGLAGILASQRGTTEPAQVETPVHVEAEVTSGA